MKTYEMMLEEQILDYKRRMGKIRELAEGDFEIRLPSDMADNPEYKKLYNEASRMIDTICAMQRLTLTPPPAADATPDPLADLTARVELLEASSNVDHNIILRYLEGKR